MFTDRFDGWHEITERIKMDITSQDRTGRSRTIPESLPMIEKLREHMEVVKVKEWSDDDSDFD